MQYDFSSSPSTTSISAQLTLCRQTRDSNPSSHSISLSPSPFFSLGIWYQNWVGSGLQRCPTATKSSSRTKCKITFADGELLRTWRRRPLPLVNGLLLPLTRRCVLGPLIGCTVIPGLLLKGNSVPKTWLIARYGRE